jgi:hypothetical protein
MIGTIAAVSDTIVTRSRRTAVRRGSLASSTRASAISRSISADTAPPGAKGPPVPTSSNSICTGSLRPP